MTTKQTFKKFGVSLPLSIMNEVEEMRIKEGRSRAEIIREALRIYLHARKSSPMFGVGGLGIPVTTEKEGK